MLKNRDITVPCEHCEKRATIYYDTDAKVKACILYFHGGGLLFGSRNDLPEIHLHLLTENGYPIIAFDYPLAPSAKLDLILEDVCASVNHFIGHLPLYLEEKAEGKDALPDRKSVV